MTPEQCTELFARLAAANPEPETELIYHNAYQLLVAVILSAQATDVGVNKATTQLFQIVQTPQDMLALGENGLKQHIRSIGLYPSKARHILAMSRLLVERHNGQVPASRAELEALPGVGRKTANVVLNVAFGEPTMAVDTHIFRVANRTGLAPGRTVREVEDKLMTRVPEAYRQHAHHWLILHGRYICKARKPLCERCPIVDLCASASHFQPASLADSMPSAATPRSGVH
ncbi:MAG: endonuclease III [Candidatus Macondimonas sp.]